MAMRTIKWLRIIVFAAFVCAPMACLPLFGAPQPYGRNFTPFPSLSDLVEDDSARPRLASALLDRSILRSMAISTEDTIDYAVFGYVDTPLVVSGRNGWLFYKDQFWNGQCVPDQTFETDLAHADTLQDMAAAAGIRLIFSVSPDKATVLPEDLSPAARAYWRCKPENGDRWRALARKIAPRVIDHAVALLQAKQAAPDEQYYFQTDTHWTPLSGAWARRQLVTALMDEPADRMPPPRVAPGAFLERPTDMGNNMLLMTLRERVPEIDEGPEKAVAALAATHDFGTTTVVHDSFDAVYSKQFQALFPGSQFFGYGQAPVSRLAASDTILVDSVERYFFAHVETDTGWNADLAKTILKRNEDRAGSCTGNRPTEVVDDGTLGPANMTRGPDGHWSVTGKDPQLPVRVPATAAGALPCLDVTVVVDAADMLRIGLPAKDTDPASPAIAAGRSISVAVAPGRNRIRLVLPAYVAGQTVRIEPVSTAVTGKVTAVATGELATE